MNHLKLFLVFSVSLLSGCVGLQPAIAESTVSALRPQDAARLSVYKVDTIAKVSEGGSRHNLQELHSDSLGIQVYGSDELDAEIAVQVLGYFLDGNGDPDGAFSEYGIFILKHDASLSDNGNTIIAASYSFDSTPTANDGFWVQHLLNTLPHSGSLVGEHVIGKIREVAKLSPWSDSPVNILGDSISHGANATDAPRESWASLLKRMIMSESRNTNWGFISLNDLIGGGAYKDIANITRSGTWEDKTGADADDSISGYYLSSSNSGDFLEIDLPMGWNSSYVWFKGRTDGATIDVQVNGASVGTLNTASAGATAGWLKYGPYTMTGDSQGRTVLKLLITSAGTVDLIGISALQDVYGPQVNNFSNSGREFEHLTSDIITKAFTGSRCTILALGANDFSDDPSEAAIVSNADLIIASANSQGTKLVVADFVWYRKLNNFMRRELKRIADSVEGAVYLPFPDWFDVDPTTVPSSNYLQNDLKLFSDAIHPNKSGHKLIAEAIARSLGYDGNSSRALSDWGLWWPLELQGTASNTFTNTVYNSAILEDGNGLSIRLFIDLPTAPTGETIVASLPSWIELPYSDYRVFSGDAGTNDKYKISVKSGAGGNITITPLDGPITQTRFIAQFSLGVSRVGSY